jgi:hypothetical protein
MPARKSKAKAPKAQKSTSATLAALHIPPPAPLRIKMSERKSAVSLIVKSGHAPPVQTVVYIHGIGNKPLPAILKCQWDSALFGVELGDRSRMAYWVNREYYPTPSKETCGSGDKIEGEDDEATTKSIMALGATAPTGETPIELEIRALQDSPARQQFLRRIADKMLAKGEADAQAATAGALGAKFLPLPAFLRRRITEKLTRVLLRDVNDFLFNAAKRQAMEQTLVDRLSAGGGPFVVVAHSQGSLIAYNVLRRMPPSCDVRLFVTIGSPLGLDEVQDVFKQWHPGPNPLRIPECVKAWVNVADRLDPVAVDNDISNDFTPVGAIKNHSGWFLNKDSPWHAHSGTGYLRTDEVRGAIKQVVGNAFAQPIAKAIIARDLVEDIENTTQGERHDVLIQLDIKQPGTGDVSIGNIRRQVVDTIQQLVTENTQTADDAAIDEMKRYVAAKLTRLEIERLRSIYGDLKIERVWRDARKRALIFQSANTVQSSPALRAYNSSGRDICWAVLDTGIRADHPHFERFHNVERQWDCARSGPPREVTPAESATLDGNGHGTHVAGIIAGDYEVNLNGRLTRFSGMAPETRLYGFKVLDDQGNGQDSWIIKALDQIADLNEAAGRLLIQGINLSLGGNFDPSVFGCGHTPLCAELRRLWGQGVIVCLAAGNEGYALLQASSGSLPANMDLSIGDPANLQEAIAVGSIHKTNPHTYGVSYFSSRGPTADGRRKPDLVAPGEGILSALHNWNRNRPAPQRTADDLYIEMSGTSMAAPHVSGIIAAFLCLRREFIGYPDRVKEILLSNCTDLGRDIYIQGRGMPNLVKMLANT